MREDYCITGNMGITARLLPQISTECDSDLAGASVPQMFLIVDECMVRAAGKTCL